MPEQADPDVAQAMTRAPSPPPTGRQADGPGDRRSTVGARRRRHWPLLVALSVLGALLLGGGAYGYGRLSPPSYTADALVAVVPNDPTTGLSLPISGIYVQVGRSEALLQAAAGELRVKEAQLRSSVSVTQPDQNAPLVQVSATTPDAQRSANWANTVANRLITQAAPTPVPGYGLRLVASAVAPTVKNRPVTPLITLAAAVIGALAGVVLARGFIAVRRRRRSEAEVH